MAIESFEARKSLALRDIGLVLLTSIGGAMEFYDFTLFAFFSATLARAFFPADAPAWLASYEILGVFAAAYLARPLGGVVLANFGDMLGRKHIYMFSIGLMTFATFGVAIIPSYATIGLAAPIILIFLRCLQGIAIGGEIPGGWTYISEQVPVGRRGLCCGILCSGLSVGILFGVGIAFLFQTYADPVWFNANGWRYPFVLGGVVGLAAMAARRYLQETPVFHEIKSKGLLIPDLPFRVVIRDFRLSVTICVVLTWLLSASIVVTTMLNVNYLHRFVGYSIPESLLATAVGVIALILTSGPFGALADRFGPGPVFVGGSLFLAVSVLLFYSYASVSLTHLFLLNGLLGTAVGLCGAVPYVLVSAFPPQVRYTGVSFSYNVSYAVFGGLTPLAVNRLMEFDPMSYAYYLCILSSFAFLIGLYILFRRSETVILRSERG